jgi:tellurite resistance protein TerC
MVTKVIDFAYRNARRVVVAIVGGTVLLIGLALVVLPGPAFVVIPIGLAILGLEFAWARSWLQRVRRSLSARSLAPFTQSAERD